MAQNAGNKRSMPSIPDISDLLLLTQKQKTLIEENEVIIYENFNVIKDIVHKPFVQTILEQDNKRIAFPKGSEDAKQFLEASLSCTLRSIEIAFILGREYAEHYKENPKAILLAERFDSVAITISTQNELKRISEYGAFWIMRLDEMCLFARYIDKSTMLHGLDLHLSQVQTAVFHAFKDGIANYYNGVFDTNAQSSPSYKNTQQSERQFLGENKMSSNNNPDKIIDGMNDLEQRQFVIDKLLPAMEQVALDKLAEREAVRKKTMAYAKNAINERNRNIAIRNAIFMGIGLIIVALILIFIK